MEDVLLYFVLVTGIVNVVAGLTMKTKNFISSLIFKVIPFFCGCSCILYFLFAMNLVN